MEAKSRILGIDPGSRVTGFGIIEYQDKKWQCITTGSWKLEGVDFIGRLKNLQQEIDQLIAQFNPNQVAIEDVFVHQNPRGALKLGQARGVIIASMLRHSLPIAEYAPRQVKQTVVGKGGAGKEQVQAMVKLLLKLDVDLTLDASDALAIALTHGHVNTGLAAVIQSNQFSRKGRGKRSGRWLANDWKNRRTTD